MWPVDIIHELEFFALGYIHILEVYIYVYAWSYEYSNWSLCCLGRPMGKFYW